MMWGNFLGWRISAVIFAVAMGAAIWLRGEMQITDPTSLSLDPKNLAELAPPIGAEAIVTQDQAGDAGEKYLAASQAYQDDPDTTDEYSQKPEGPPPPPMELVMEGTHLSQMNLFARNPGEVIDYQTDHPELDGLGKIGDEMESAALRLQRAGKMEDARKLLLGAYSLGLNLLRERVDYDEYSHGMGLMDGATTALAEMEPAGSAKAQMLEGQEAAMEGYDHDVVEPIYEVLTSADPAKIAANAGDIFRFATRSRERMFRVEAILKLGRYRFNSARAADQMAAPRFLRFLGHDADPAVRAAAQAAGGLTVEQYRMIH
jgi:hypothetical protein